MSVNSMTGFARATGRVEGDADGCSWTWELKSVNGKGLDARCRLPAGFERLEQTARARVKGRLGRGNVAAALTLDWDRLQSGMRVNHGALEKIISLLPEIQERLPEAPPPRIEGLLALRGVMEAPDSPNPGAEPGGEPNEEFNGALLAGLDEALDSLAAMRAGEGAALAAVLESQLNEMTRLIDAAAGLAAFQPAAVKQRLKTQIEEMLAQVPALPEEKLAHEAALLMTKSDVREELDRLKAHVAAAKALLKDGGAVGRKLDFLCQEFSREANTLCSKSPDVEMTRLGLDMKAIIDQLREQAQNIE